MQLQTLKLVNIVAEELLKEKICKRAKELGATGYTVFEVDGDGERGIRDDKVGGESNVQIQIVCSAATAEKILTYVAHYFFENFAVVAWMTDVSVVRGDHYIKDK